ncbi:amidohydrolase [Nocardia macrotermitis]|uniref:N-acetyldiaminopimelate deacetylase n=1 Tax=Nocardia macrotermitis TaxID=2585198 RepID=A0A7K0D0H3_9NOCA|nr:amidohydrolase [Nocardia macrotermitis]MQY19236.1 N-acetyldiaminopimelate deacetylase [Nocardia macrotermitis]
MTASADIEGAVRAGLAAVAAMPAADEHWLEIYRHLHAHPELSGAEVATARLVADELRAMPGWEVTEGVGGTGVVGVLGGGPGPVIWLRADMDALPVQEETGLDYASRTPGVMHACGHDVHVTALLGACARLAAHTELPGTVVAVFQPAEETGFGARGMLDDGLLERFPTPRIVLGQHVGPVPAGLVLSRGGALMAASDSIRIELTGSGGHASMPHAAVNPLTMAASLVLRLQGLAAQHSSLPSPPVLTPGALHVGDRPNVIAETAEMLLSLRTFTSGSRETMLEGVRRMTAAEAESAGAHKDPTIEVYDSFPMTVNTAADTDRLLATFAANGFPAFPLPGPITGSEDFGAFATAANCASVFWYVGGFSAARYTAEDWLGLAREMALPAGTESNHSPRFAPDPEETLPPAINAMVVAANSELARG